MHSDFKDKEIYKKTKELYILLNKILNNKVPYALKDQILRANISILLNFAEGYGRFHKNDKKQFYLTSRASLNEVIACFDLVEVHTDISEIDKKKFDEISGVLGKMISGLINKVKWC